MIYTDIVEARDSSRRAANRPYAATGAKPYDAPAGMRARRRHGLEPQAPTIPRTGSVSIGTGLAFAATPITEKEYREFISHFEPGERVSLADLLYIYEESPQKQARIPRLVEEATARDNVYEIAPDVYFRCDTPESNAKLLNEARKIVKDAKRQKLEVGEVIAEEQFLARLARAVRYRGGITAIARRAQVSHSTVVRILNGQRRPGAKFLEGLGVSAAIRIPNGDSLPF